MSNIVWITTEEAAKVANCSLSTIASLARDHALLRRKKNPEKPGYLYDRAHIEAYATLLAEHREGKLSLRAITRKLRAATVKDMLPPEMLPAPTMPVIEGEEAAKLAEALMKERPIRVKAAKPAARAAKTSKTPAKAAKTAKPAKAPVAEAPSLDTAFMAWVSTGLQAKFIANENLLRELLEARRPH